MPELAEVETLKRYLEKHIINFKIDKLLCHRKNLRYNLSDDLSIKAEGSSIIKLDRRAKTSHGY